MGSSGRVMSVGGRGFQHAGPTSIKGLSELRFPVADSVYTCTSLARLPTRCNDKKQPNDISQPCVEYTYNILYLFTLFFFHKIRDHIVTGFDRIPDAACRT